MSNYLTQKEVNNLEVGIEVEITWSGGNGPHNYTIKSHTISGKACIDNCYEDPIDFVGDSAFHTRIKLVAGDK